MSKEVKILIADDHYLIAKLIKMMLTTANENYEVELAKSSTEVFNCLAKHSPDLILLDIDMPEIDGLQILKKVKSGHSEIKILMISNHTEAWIIKRSLKLGADGYISKYADSDEILAAIKSVLNHENYLCKNTIKSLYLSSNTDKKELVSTHLKNAIGNLSKRELEVLKLVVEEYSTKDIADLLFISTRTVETHRKNILAKLGVKSTLSLIKIFMETNMTDIFSET